MLQFRVPYILLFLFLVTAFASTGETDSLTLNEITSPPTYSAAVFDTRLSMRSGAETILGIHNGLGRFEDMHIKSSLFSEEKLSGRAGGILYRFAKYTLIDLPVDAFAGLFAHEYFGHGARFREQDWVNVHYEYELPPPYGNGHGTVSGNTSGSRMYTDHEFLAFYSGGLEVQSLMNRNLCLRWTARREIHYREAFVYTFSLWSNFSYIISTKGEDLEDYETGHDVVKYLRLLNNHAGYSDINNLLMNPENLNYRNMINLVNPFFFYTLYTGLRGYIWDGNNSTKLKMFNIKGIEYLPSCRMGLTPFGPEYHLENYFRAKSTVFLLDLRTGDPTFYKSWGGIGLFFQNIYENKRFSLDAKLDIWKQPEIEIGGYPATLKGGGLGGAFSLRGYYDFTNSQFPISAILELGYKSAGFLEGYTLDSSPTIMFGIGIRN